MHSIFKEPMSYKSYCKDSSPVGSGVNSLSPTKNLSVLTTKVRIISLRYKDAIDIKTIVSRFTMHRNTVSNIMSDFDVGASPEIKAWIKDGRSFSSEEILTHFSFLFPQSRKPKTNKRVISSEQESQVISYFQSVKVGSAKLSMML